MNFQDKLSKLGALIGRGIDTAVQKAEEAKLKDKIVAASVVVKEGVVDVSKRSKNAYQAFRQEPEAKVESKVEVQPQAPQQPVEVVHKPEVVQPVVIKSRPRGMSRAQWRAQNNQ